jgi:hypothetical protein
MTMFSNLPPEESSSDLSDVIFPKQESLTENRDDTEVSRAIKAIPPETQLETVKVVEKVSSILSPYFIVLVGLFLYQDNFLFGSILIITGILSLLKISWTDIVNAIDKIKTNLNSPDDGSTF